MASRKDAAAKRNRPASTPAPRPAELTGEQGPTAGNPNPPNPVQIPDMRDSAKSPEVPGAASREPISTPPAPPLHHGRLHKPLESGLPAPAAELPPAEQARQVRSRVKVRATRAGYYDHIRRRTGDVFTISGERLAKDLTRKSVDTDDPDVVDDKGRVVYRKKGELKEFSHNWMEFVDERTPENVTTPNQHIARENQRESQRRAAGGPIDD